MQCFVKSFSDFRTVAQAPVIASALVVDSVEPKASSLTAAGDSITQDHVGDWLIADGMLFLIKTVSPQQGRVTLGLTSPLEVLGRKIELSPHFSSSTVGAFVEDVLNALWWLADDPFYALPYLRVSNLDTTPFVPPETDNAGLFQLNTYLLLMRKSYGTTISFIPEDDTLHVYLSAPAPVRKQIVFDDGHSQLSAATFGSTGVAKVTVIQDVKTGEKAEDDTDITERIRRHFYMDSDGSITQDMPSIRAAGRWETITVGESDDLPTIEEKVLQLFAQNKTNHKIEFYSDRDLPVMSECRLLVYGIRLDSHVTYKRKAHNDNRYFYRCGELAVTATEKLRRF